MSTGKLPLIEGADGVTLLSTWLIAIQEDYDFANSVLEGSAPRDARAYRLVLTLNHEAVHFIQGMTAATPYSYSLNLLELCDRLMREARTGSLDADGLTRYRADYKKLNGLLAAETEKVSTVDILEAMAVVESFRATSIKQTAGDFVKYLENCFGASESQYRRVIDIIRSMFGEQVALESTSRICFLALNADSPPRSFWKIIETLRSLEELDRLSAIEMAKVVGLDYRTSLLAQHSRLKEQRSAHKILAPYIHHLSTLGSLEEAFEFAARPSDWLSGGTHERAGKLMPPVVLFGGGRGYKLGLARQWSKEEFFMFMDAAALVGACQEILTSSAHYLACPHSRECPVHRTKLCHAWYAVPDRWETCAFPKRFKLHFGKYPEELLRLGSDATAFNQVSESDKQFSPFIGRSKEEYCQLLNNAAELGDPKEWDKIVISLLSEAEVDEIKRSLLDNTAYLVVSVSGYLLDMVGNLPKNPLQEWMDDQRRTITDEDIEIIRQVARSIAVQESPWFGLAMLRALDHILSLDVKKREIPRWIDEDIGIFAAKIKKSS